MAWFHIEMMDGNFQLFSMILRSLHDGIGHVLDHISFFRPLNLDIFSNSHESYPCYRTFANSRAMVRRRWQNFSLVALYNVWATKIVDEPCIGAVNLATATMVWPVECVHVYCRIA